MTSVANAEAVSKEMLQYDRPSGSTSQGHLVSDAVGGAAANAMPGFSGCGQANVECKTYIYDGDGRQTNVAFTVGGISDSNTPDRATTYFPSGRVKSVTSTVDSDT